VSDASLDLPPCFCPSPRDSAEHLAVAYPLHATP
jgi:hypothetical protein